MRNNLKIYTAALLNTLIVLFSSAMDQSHVDKQLRDIAEIEKTIAVQALLGAESEADATDKWQWSPLHLAAAKGYSGVAKALVKNTNANVDGRNQYHITPLHLAAGRRAESVVQILLDAGANPNAPDINLQTPLHWAALAGDEHIIRILFNAKAKPLAFNDHRMTPLQVAATYGHESATEYLEAITLYELLEYGASLDEIVSHESVEDLLEEYRRKNRARYRSNNP